MASKPGRAEAGLGPSGRMPQRRRDVVRELAQDVAHGTRCGASTRAALFLQVDLAREGGSLAVRVDERMSSSRTASSRKAGPPGRKRERREELPPVHEGRNGD